MSTGIVLWIVIFATIGFGIYMGWREIKNERDYNNRIKVLYVEAEPNTEYRKLVGKGIHGDIYQYVILRSKFVLDNEYWIAYELNGQAISTTAEEFFVFEKYEKCEVIDMPIEEDTDCEPWTASEIENVCEPWKSSNLHKM